MKKPKSSSDPLEVSIENELLRRRALHHVQDAAQLLRDMLPIQPGVDARRTITAITGELETVERKLEDLVL